LEQEPRSASLVIGMRKWTWLAKIGGAFAPSRNAPCTRALSGRSTSAVARKLSLVTQALTRDSGEAR
jgi:hypothetical protein